MSLQRIIELQLNANGVARGLQDIQRHLGTIDQSIDGINSKPLMGGRNGQGGTAPINRASRALIDYEGQLSNVQRTITQTIGAQSRSEAAMLKYDTVTRKLNQAVAQGRLSQEEYNQALRQANTAYSVAAKQAADYDNQMNKMIETSGKTKGAFTAMRGSSAQFGMQLQDIIVQMEMGAAAGTIIAQQGPQIASLFGAGGAALGVVIALAGALGGPLIESLLGVNNALKELEDISSKLDDSFKSAENGARSFSDELVRTYQVSQDLARLDLSIEILRLDQALQLVAGSTDAVFDGMNDWFGFLGGFDTRQAVESLEALREAGLSLDDLFSGGNRNFIPVQIRGAAEYGSEAQSALATFRREAQDIQREIEGIDLRSASGLVEIISQVRGGGNSEADFNAQVTALNAWVQGLSEAGQVTDENRKALIEMLGQVQMLIETGRQAFLTRDMISPELLEQFSEFESAVRDTSAYVSELALGYDRYSSVISDIRSQEEDINGILTERLQSLRIQGDEQAKIEAAGAARAQARNALDQARTQTIADYLYDLGAEVDFQDEINRLRARGLEITEATAQAAIEMAEADTVLDFMDDTDIARISELNAQIDLMARNAQSFNDDAAFQEAFQAMKDELIELGQDGGFLQRTSEKLDDLFSAGAETALFSHLRQLREQGAITTEQFEDMTDSYRSMSDARAESQGEALADIVAETNAYREGAEAVEEYRLRMEALAALDLRGIDFLSMTPEERAAAESVISQYIAALRQREEQMEKGADDWLTRVEDGLSDIDWGGYGSEIGGALADALITGDTSGLGSAFGGIASTATSSALTSALGSGFFASIASGFGGAAVGGIVSGLMSGKEEISRSVRVVFGDGIAQAFTDIEYDSMLGGSSSILNFTQVENERVTNSFRNMARNLSREFDAIGLAVGELSGTFEGDSVSDALSNAAEDYVNAGFESIDKFQEFGESAVDAFGRIVDQIKTMQDGLIGLTDRGVQASIDQFIQGQAEEFNEQAELGAGYWETSIVALRDLAAGANAPLQAAAGDLVRGTAEYERVFNEWLSRRSGSNGNFMFQTQNVLDEAEGHIAWIEANQLPEAIGRLDEGMTVATASFAETLENAVEGDLASAFQAMADVTATESENLATQLENARDAIEALGFDRNITSAQFSAQLAAAQVEPISAEALANFLNAAVELERISELTEEFTSSLTQDVDGAFSVLRRAIDAERDALTKKYNAEREAAQDVLETMRDGLSNLETVANSLKAAIEQAVDESASVRMARLTSARAEIERLAATGILPDAEVLDRLLSRVTGDNAQYYSNAEDYYAEQAETANDIADLSKLADDQLSEAEQQIRNQEEQLELMEEQHNASMEALDMQLEAYQRQYDALMGIDIRVLSVADAIKELQGSLSGLAVSREIAPSGGTSAITSGMIKARADEIVQQNTSGGVTDWDAAGTEIARQAVAAGLSAGDIAGALGVSVERVVERANELGVPLDGSHADGLDYVPFDGYRAELHRGEMVLTESTANAVRNMSGGAADMTAELRMIRSELRDLRAETRSVVKYSKQTARSNDELVDLNQE